MHFTCHLPAQASAFSYCIAGPQSYTRPNHQTRPGQAFLSASASASNVNPHARYRRMYRRGGTLIHNTKINMHGYQTASAVQVQLTNHSHSLTQRTNNGPRLRQESKKQILPNNDTSCLSPSLLQRTVSFPICFSFV